MKFCIRGKIEGEIKENEHCRVGDSDIYCGCFDDKDCDYLKKASYGKEVWQCEIRKRSFKNK